MKITLGWVAVGAILLLSNYIRMRSRLKKRMQELEAERKRKAELVKQLQSRKHKARIVELKEVKEGASILLDETVSVKKMSKTQEKLQEKERKKATQKAKEEAERRRKSGMLV